ncbi:MAG TPA: DUF1425 domain-containing protein [Planctomycetes bacterium]|nr:DUF1425 domain-containing protein [Planctomycetota bacterium]
MKHPELSTPTRTLLGLALLAGIGSCVTPRGTAQNTYSMPREGVEVEQDIGSPGLARDLVMESITTRRKDGRLQVAFDLRSTRASDMAFEWSLIWLDDHGFPLPTPRNWNPAFLRGKGFLTVTRTAPTPEATGFRLALSRPDSVR